MQRMLVQDALGRQWATHDVLGITQDSLGRLWFANRAGVGCQTSTGWQFYTGEDGLPYNEFTQISAGPRGEVWFGTTKGLVRFRNGQWGYRQGKRWVPNDIIQSVKVDHHGHVWVATQTGIGVIRQQTMTLSEKAAHYEHEIETYIKRTPFGYISEVTLPEAGVKERIQYHDSDNDGLWTSMYGAGECFAFAATGNQDAARRAHQAFRALAFLQEVTQGGSHPAPKGMSLVPSDQRPCQIPMTVDLKGTSALPRKGTPSGRSMSHDGLSVRMESGIGKVIPAPMSSMVTSFSTPCIMIWSLKRMTKKWRSERS